MGILDGIVDWLATQVMNLLDLASTSVLGALGCNMDTFKRYFPAASSMYEIFIWTAIGLVLLNLVWQLYRCYGAGFDIDTENPINLVVRSVIFLLLIWYCDDIVNLALQIGGHALHLDSGQQPARRAVWRLQFRATHHHWRDCQRFCGLDCTDSRCDSGLELLKAAFGSRRAIRCTGNSGFHRTPCLCYGRGARHKQHFQKLVPNVQWAASAADYERMVLKTVRQYGR